MTVLTDPWNSALAAVLRPRARPIHEHLGKIIPPAGRRKILGLLSLRQPVVLLLDREDRTDLRREGRPFERGLETDQAARWGPGPVVRGPWGLVGKLEETRFRPRV